MAVNRDTNLTFFGPKYQKTDIKFNKKSKDIKEDEEVGSSWLDYLNPNSTGSTPAYNGPNTTRMFNGNIGVPSSGLELNESFSLEMKNGGRIRKYQSGGFNLGIGDKIMDNSSNSTGVNNKQYIAGSALKDAGKYAAAGATIGSIVPGVGTLLGAGLGAATGAIIGGIRGRKEANQIDEETTQNNINTQAQIDAENLHQENLLNQRNMIKPYIYPMGGIIPNGISELEKQENTLNPDGSSLQVDGPSHSNGGVKTSLQPGTMIFSDRLKFGKKTFAELNKINNTNKEDKLINDENSSSSLRKTAELMKEAKIRNSQNLFKQQEELKRDKVAKYASKLGLTPNDLTINPVDTTTNQNSQQMFAFGGIKKFGPGGKDYSSFWNSRFAGAAAGERAYLAEQGKDYDTQKFYNYDPTLLDNSQALRDADRSATIAEKGLRNATGGDSSQYLSNRLSLNAQTLSNKERIRQEYVNQNAQISNQGKMFSIGNRYTTDQINAQNKAAALSQYYQAIDSLGNNNAQRREKRADQAIDIAGKVAPLFI